ncbi:MAG: OmpA family protein [Verrucomicrobia bacterium]|jgi:outer membrane protein OmpA-like peptidoglycan-associated protein|nr:OmpA family protein [Verrucomicrobiota bacterium]
MSRIHRELQNRANSEWFVRISDGSTYGPVDLTTLQSWAAQGRIEPENELSEDQESWIHAMDLPELEMDWLVELEDGTLYGPFNIQLAPELMQRGALPPESVIKHRETGETRTMGSSDNDDLLFPLEDLPEPEQPKRKRKAPTPRKRKKAEPKPVAEEPVVPAEPEEPTVSEAEQPEAAEPEESATSPESDEGPTPESAGEATAVQAEPTAPESGDEDQNLVTAADRQELVAQRLEALQQSASQARTQLSTTRKELTEQRAATTAMQDQIRKLQEDVRNAEAEKEISERQLLEQQDMVAQAVSESENLNAQLQQLQDHYDRLQIESQNQFEALDQLRSESMQREQELKRKIGRETDRANAKTSLLAQAMRLILQDAEIEHGKLPPELLAGTDPVQLQELQARVSHLQQLSERERKHAQTLEMELASARGSRSRNLLVLGLIILVVGLTCALALVLGQRGFRVHAAARSPGSESSPARAEAPIKQPDQPALAGAIVTNTERIDHDAPAPVPAVDYDNLDLAPEANKHPEATGIVSPPSWPELVVPRSTVSKSDTHCSVSFTYGIFSSSTQFTPDAIEDLANLSNQLRGCHEEFTLLVEGHTDATPISSQRAKYVDNFALGMARAEKVKLFLEDQCRLPEGFIRTASAGESDPPYPNTTDASRRKNRTVVLTLTPR